MFYGEKLLLYVLDFQEYTYLAPNLNLSMAGTSSKVQPLVENLFLGRLAVVGE